MTMTTKYFILIILLFGSTLGFASNNTEMRDDENTTFKGNPSQTNYAHPSQASYEQKKRENADRARRRLERRNSDTDPNLIRNK